VLKNLIHPSRPPFGTLRGVPKPQLRRKENRCRRLAPATGWSPNSTQQFFSNLLAALGSRDAQVAWRSMSKPVGPYTPIVRAGDWLICSGQVGIADGKLVDGGLDGQLRRAMANMGGLLESQDASMDDVVKTTVFLTDMADYEAMNEIYVEVFGDHRPARSAVAVASLPLGAQIEIEAWAWARAG
jgi:2-iminobutanoate/2-iminopropanoate deaminase